MLKKTLLTLSISITILMLLSLIRIDNKDIVVKKIIIKAPEIISKMNPIQEKPIGIISIPKINLNKPLYSIDSKKNNVEENVTILKESTYPSNDNSILYIAAHSGTGNVAFFNELNELQINDEIIIEYNNKQYKYIVNNIYEQKKNGYISGLRENKKQLVLTTCCPNKDNCQLIINSIEKESY